MAHRQFDGQAFYNFVWSWRTRLLKGKHAHELSDEEFGQLLTLNTILAYIDDHSIHSLEVKPT